MTDLNDHTVYVVDDDQSIRDALVDLLSSFDMRVLAFGSAADYLACPKPKLAACLVLDVQLPDINGLEFQNRLAGAGLPPIVFITGHGDIPSSVRAIKAGAIDYLTKPFSDVDLIRAVRSALTQSQEFLEKERESASLRLRYQSLTPRESEVLPLIVSGLLNKQAADELGISEVTFQIHRGRIMKKMEADSLPELVRIAASLGISLSRSRHGIRK